MTAPRIFTYTITFFGDVVITVQAANKMSACHFARVVYGQGGTRWAAIEKIERSIATGSRPRVAACQRVPAAHFIADGEAPL